jgi:hypothetical protein
MPTAEEQDRLDKRAAEAARRERANDPNLTDPKHTQERMDDAVHELRVQMGLEKR